MLYRARSHFARTSRGGDRTTRSGRPWIAALTLIASLAACGGPSCPTSPVAPAPAQTQAAVAEPTAKYGEVPGVNLLGDVGVRAFVLQGERSSIATVSVVKVEGQPFGEALRAEVRERPTNNWDVQVAARTKADVEQGDVLLATFYFRTERSKQESAEGETEFVFELAQEPWTKSISYPVRAGKEWRKIHVPFKAVQSHRAGEAQMIFRLGFEPQTIEIGGVTVENFGKKLALSALPVTKITYAGMEPDAPWRAAAEARIEQHRKAALAVTVKDKAGKVVPDAQVSAKLVRHAFGFGTCVPANLIVGPNANERFKQHTVELFNVATLENDLKWVALAGDWGSGFSLDAAQGAIDWLRDKGLDVRGHVMVWPGWRNLPRFLRQYEKDPERLRSEVRKRIRDVGNATKGKLAHWDVLNEPFDNHDLMDILGQDVMVEWFKEARAVDPAAKLFINDYAILSGGGGGTAHRDHYEKTIQFLLAKGAPLDGIGLQGHFGAALTSPEDMLAILDRYAKFKKPIYVTEYDVVIDDEALAGQFTRDFYTTLFSHPAVQGIVMWGFWDGAHWKKNAALYREDWSLKPGGQAYRDLVLGAWRTDVSGKTDARGAFSTRGFLGDYEIAVDAAGKQKKVRAKLAPGGSTVTVVLD